jgi:mycothiol synthase
VLEIRERDPDEVEIEVEIVNTSLPADDQLTPEVVRVEEEIEKNIRERLRLLAIVDGVPAGTGNSGQGQIAPAGRFDINVVVRPEYRRQGVGSALYEKLLSYAMSSGAHEAQCYREENELAPILPWLEEEGFREVARMRRSVLHLDRLDDIFFDAAEERVRASGIELTSAADLKSEDDKRRLWSLSNALFHDVPADEPMAEGSYEHFCAFYDSPTFFHEPTIVALAGQKFVGVTLVTRGSGDHAGIAITGVLPEYRGKGIAAGMKARSSRVARDHGVSQIRTQSHTNNPPMLAVNEQLGFEKLSEIVFMVKVLSIKRDVLTASKRTQN